MKKFYLSGVVYTFANIKRGASKNESFACTLYLYSSHCAPILMGGQTTDLMGQIYYHPILKDSYYYEPKQIQYISQRNNERKMKSRKHYLPKWIQFITQGIQRL